MRYWCRECESTIDIPLMDGISIDCLVCNEGGNCQNQMDAIPEYETIKQWEERTGKKITDDDAVWWRHPKSIGEKDGWEVDIYYHVRKVTYIDNAEPIILVCQSPEPPPDDWKESV